MAPPDSWSLVYDPGHHVILLHWHRPCALAAAVPVYEQLLWLARRNSCHRWLLDNRGAGPLHAAFLNWLADAFLPRALARLAPHGLRLAVLSSAERLAALHQHPELAPAFATLVALRRPFEGRYFLNEGSAVAWLLARPD